MIENTDIRIEEEVAADKAAGRVHVEVAHIDSSGYGMVLVLEPSEDGTGAVLDGTTYMLASTGEGTGYIILRRYSDDVVRGFRPAVFDAWGDLDENATIDVDELLDSMGYKAYGSRQDAGGPWVNTNFGEVGKAVSADA